MIIVLIVLASIFTWLEFPLRWLPPSDTVDLCRVKCLAKETFVLVLVLSVDKVGVGMILSVVKILFVQLAERRYQRYAPPRTV